MPARGGAINLRLRIRDHARSGRLPDGTRVFLRPLREADLEHAQEYFARLSDETRYLRFMIPTPNLTADALARVVDALHEARAAITVATVDHGQRQELIGGARVVPTDRVGTSEFAISVVDAWQGRGVGTVLMREVVRLARALHYHRVEGTVLSINTKMLTVARRLRFQLRPDPQDRAITIVSRTMLP